MLKMYSHLVGQTNRFLINSAVLKERVYRMLSVAVAETRPSTGCFAKRAERACTRLCPATEPAGARVALLRCPILRASAAIVLYGC